MGVVRLHRLEPLDGDPVVAGPVVVAPVVGQGTRVLLVADDVLGRAAVGDQRPVVVPPVGVELGGGHPLLASEQAGELDHGRFACFLISN